MKCYLSRLLGFLAFEENSLNQEKIHNTLIKIINLSPLKFVHLFIGHGKMFGDMPIRILLITIFFMIRAILALDAEHAHSQPLIWMIYVLEDGQEKEKQNAGYIYNNE